MKRLFDIVVSFIALLILFPFFIPIMLILRVTGEGEVFYRQKRIGYGCKPFYITKFATMLKDSPNIGTGEITLQNDPRVLPLGDFLRKTKINELPQFWDILIGTMSFVGPRPQTPKTVDMFPDEYRNILKKIRPGVTGVGSIVFRDEEAILSNAKDFDACFRNEVIPYKAEMEVWYYENQTFMMDIILCFITAWSIFKPNSKVLYNSYPTIPVRDTDNFGK
jgi:lipopolysaccharide/colanic/teichoic acid biosynthesis glycosyltransferase